MIGLVVIGHYPLNHSPARQGLESLEAFLLGWKSVSTAVSCIQTTVFVCISLLIALSVRPYALCEGSALEWFGKLVSGLLVESLGRCNVCLVGHQGSQMQSGDGEQRNDSQLKILTCHQQKVCSIRVRDGS